jgi:ElaA protein
MIPPLSTVGYQLSIIKDFGQLSALELYRILEAREQVFMLEQRVDCEDLDGVDMVSTHMWTEEDGRVAGYLRMIPPGAVYEQASIGRVLVTKEFRRQGLSRRMMNEAIQYMTGKWGVGEIMISAQAYLTGYYGDLGFEIVSGEYLDGGIPHYKMLFSDKKNR